MKKIDNKIVLKEINPIVTAAQSLLIRTPEQMTQSAEMLSRINQLLDGLKKEKEELTKPINDSLKAIRLRYKPMEEPLEAAKTYLRSEQSRYQTEQIKIAQKADAKVAADLNSGKIKKFETAVKRVEAIDRPDEQVIAESGTLNFRKDPVVKVIDKAKIPLEFLIVDEKAILAKFKAGEQVPGVVEDFVMVPINRR